MLLTTREYAARRGLHPRTVRLHLVEGKLPGQKIPDPVTGHPTWYVEVPDEVGDPGVRNASYPRQVFPDAYREMPDPQQERGSGWISLQEHQAIIDRYHQENIELAGRCGFYQARVRELERRVLELEAPKESGAETSDQPVPGQGGPDPTGQAASMEYGEQLQVDAVSESSASAAMYEPGASSGGAFKRFWRWLTQPV